MYLYRKIKEEHLYKHTRDYILNEKRYRVKKIKTGWYTLFILVNGDYHPFVTSKETTYKNLFVRYLNDNFNNGYYIEKVWIRTKLPVRI